MTRHCVHGSGTVVCDDRNPTPYPIEGCMVGEPIKHAGVSYLRGMSFVTRIDHETERWDRSEAPDPCPHCVADADAKTGRQEPPVCGARLSKIPPLDDTPCGLSRGHEGEHRRAVALSRERES